MPYRISYLKPRLLIQPQNSRMKSPNQTEIAYQLSNLGYHKGDCYVSEEK